MRIQDNFWQLCDIAGLTTVFRGQWPSYKRMMLEFLSALEVVKLTRSLRVVGIKFRLNNHDWELSMSELFGIFGCTEDVLMLDEFDRHAFWKEITLPERATPHVYNGQSSKASRI